MNFFKKNKIINEPLLFKFITEYLFQKINDCLNVQEIIRTYLSQKILSHISETIKYYNLIVIKDMKEINNNKQIIAESVLEIERLEENEKNLKANKRELKKKLNVKKIDLENEIKKNNKYKDSVNNNNKRDQELLKKIKEENKQLYSKIEDKKNELNNFQNDLDNLESKYEDIHFYNSILISNQSVNEILFNDHMNSIKNLNGEIIELKKKIGNLEEDNSNLKFQFSKISNENIELKKENIELKKENVILKNRINQLEGNVKILLIKNDKQNSEIFHLKTMIELNKLENQKKFEELELKIKNLCTKKE